MVIEQHSASTLSTPLARDEGEQFDRNLVRLRPTDRNENGLRWGLVRFHLPPEKNYRLRTRERKLCDAALLLVRHPDGSTDGLLSHLFPEPGARLGHMDVYDDLKIPIEPIDDVSAVLVATTHDGVLLYPENFELLKAAITRKNNGREPDIVLVDISQLEDEKLESEIVFEQQTVNGGYTQKTEVTNSSYVKTYTHNIPE